MQYTYYKVLMVQLCCTTQNSARIQERQLLIPRIKKTAFNTQNYWQGGLDTWLKLARQEVSGAHTLVGVYTKPCINSKNILIYSIEWRGKKPKKQLTPCHLCMDKKCSFWRTSMFKQCRSNWTGWYSMTSVSNNQKIETTIR